ncbi:LpqJ protein [Mycobacterium tuberculosis]|nr:LpqJ protein [Mycobacterium tuberculosis]
MEADLGALDGRIMLNDQTYTAQGWTIVPAADGTTFTNGGSGHGMSVSDQSVRSF